ncbi:IS4 family transposase, partial [Bacillus cereus]
KSLESELLEHYNFSKNVVSSSAMLQARRKLKLYAFETVFKSISSNLTREKTYRGYRLLAHDGTDLNLPTDISDEETCFNNNTSYNLLHLNA